MSIFQKLFKSESAQGAKRKEIVIVSGLPRSGTSMMMKMLEAGGLPVLTDNLREADPDNPKGYYEFERVKKLEKGDYAWLDEAQGKVVKVISALLEHLPPKYRYRVIFIHRNMNEILASHQKMLNNRGQSHDSVGDEEMARLFKMHVDDVVKWMEKQPNFSLLNVDYNKLLAEPQLYIHDINHFLGHTLSDEKMAEVVDPNLYRNRK